MTCQSLSFSFTCEEEQDINFVLLLINLANLDDKSKPNNRHLTLDFGRYNQRVVVVTNVGLI